MITDKKILDAIQSIIQLNNVNENFKTLVRLDEEVERGSINLESLRNQYRVSHNGSNNTDIRDLFDVIILKHDDSKTLYLIKGLKVLASDICIDTLSDQEKEELRNLCNTTDDNNVNEEFKRIIKEAGFFKRYECIEISIKKY